MTPGAVGEGSSFQEHFADRMELQRVDRDIFTGHCHSGSPLRGFLRAYVSLRSSAVMKSSVMATEMLKFVILFLSSLQSMNPRMSG